MPSSPRSSARACSPPPPRAGRSPTPARSTRVRTCSTSAASRWPRTGRAGSSIASAWTGARTYLRRCTPTVRGGRRGGWTSGRPSTPPGLASVPATAVGWSSPGCRSSVPAATACTPPRSIPVPRASRLRCRSTSTSARRRRPGPRWRWAAAARPTSSIASSPTRAQPTRRATSGPNCALPATRARSGRWRAACSTARPRSRCAPRARSTARAWGSTSRATASSPSRSPATTSSTASGHGGCSGCSSASRSRSARRRGTVSRCGARRTRSRSTCPASARARSPFGRPRARADGLGPRA